MSYPNSLLNLINCLKQLPSIGEKTAERLAFALLNKDEEYIKLFSSSLLDIKEKIKECVICGNITENDICEICNDSSRKTDIICVIEDAKYINLLEKMKCYNGKYHVLNGLISPMNGISPDDINIKSLIERVNNENINEIILAISPTLEGQTTSLYISKLLEDKNIIISKIAYGIPLGADIEYLDPMTFSMAIENRNKIS